MSKKGHESTVNRFLISGDYVFSISYDKTARMWDFETGECLKRLSGHEKNITSLLFIPTESDDMKRSMLLKNITSTSKLPPINLKQSSFTNSNANKDIIITGSLDMTAKSWSLETGECLKTFKGHTAPVTCMATDPYGRYLFTGSADNDIRSWEISTGKLVTIMSSHSSTVLSLFVRARAKKIFI